MKLKNILLMLPMLFITLNLCIAQDNINGKWSENKPKPGEKGSYFERGRLYSAEDEAALKNAQESGNYIEAERIMKKMDEQVPEQYKFKTRQDGIEVKPTIDIPTPYYPDWYNNDVLVWAGNVKFGDPYFRQIDMKMAEDGNIYVAFSRSPVSGVNGRIDVYRSSNGGATWTYTSGVQSTTGYFGTVSLLVEVNHASNPDSARVFVFYTLSSSSNNDNATLGYASWRRDGSAWYGGSLASPPSGQEHSFVSAVSDGAFYTTATWIGVFCTLSDNALTTTYDFRSYRSQNWGGSWSGVTIATGNVDFYPSAEFRPGSSSSYDSVWVAVERRFSNSYDVRIIRTPWTPTASSNVYYVTSASSGQYYRKPALTVKQNRSCDSAIFTVGKNNVPYYCGTVNGGGSWFTDYSLGTGSNTAFTWCASGTDGADPFMGIWVSTDGDSISLRLGGAIGNLGTYVYKRNSNNASTSVAPTCIVYNPSAGVNRAAFSYAGFGPTNIYANQENLVTGIKQTGNGVPELYTLSQNYPNPFNPKTSINFSIPKTGNVQLVVYDVMGREVAVLINNVMNSGTYNLEFDASGLASGVYMYKLASGDFTDIKKMILVK
jgi:hypothetical protein